MIKFFRKIRQNLLTENKFSKYLLYAIGEIVLVMIGILLALQVSNWNKYSQDRNSERKLLTNLHKDFLENKKQFELTKSTHQTHLSSLRSISSLLPINGNKNSADSIRYFERLIRNKTFNASSSSVELIVNSNSIELIQNDTLKQLLVSWSSVLSEYQEEEDFYYKFLFEVYYPFLVKTTDLLNGGDPLKRYSTMEYQNFVIFRRGYVISIITAIEEESIESHINEII